MEFTNTESSQLLHEYYIERKTVKSIVSEYDLEVSSRIFEKFPVYQHNNSFCECCGSKLISDFASRDNSISSLVTHYDIYDKQPVEVVSSDSCFYGFSGSFMRLPFPDEVYLTDEQYVINFPYCPSCRHEPRLNCQCENCVDYKELNYTKILSIVTGEKNVNNVPLQLDDYSTKDIFVALYLLTYEIKELDTGFVLRAIGSVSEEQQLQSKLLVQATSEKAMSCCIQMLSNVEYSFSPEKRPYVINTNFGDKHELLAKLKKLAIRVASTVDGQIEMVELWSELALQEALYVLKHYCATYSLPYRPGETTVSTIKRCLTKYGLAQTARYIYNSTKNARTYALEKGISSAQAFNSINGSINFWMDDEKCRNWNAPPFSRGKEVLEEPRHIIVFTHSFLETYGIDYFTQPINLKSFINTITEDYLI